MKYISIMKRQNLLEKYLALNISSKFGFWSFTSWKKSSSVDFVG